MNKINKNVLFLAAFVLAAASIAILLSVGAKAGTWYQMLVLIFLPVATWIVAKTNFGSNP